MKRTFALVAAFSASSLAAFSLAASASRSSRSLRFLSCSNLMRRFSSSSAARARLSSSALIRSSSCFLRAASALRCSTSAFRPARLSKAFASYTSASGLKICVEALTFFAAAVAICSDLTCPVTGLKPSVLPPMVDA